MQFKAKLLFWLHILLIVGGIIAGYFFKPWLILILIIVHEFHVYWFHGCLLSIYQKKIHAMPKKYDFFQYFFLKIFKIKLTVNQSRMVYYGIVLSSMIISLVRHGIW